MNKDRVIGWIVLLLGVCLVGGMMIEMVHSTFKGFEESYIEEVPCYDRWNHEIQGMTCEKNYDPEYEYLTSIVGLMIFGILLIHVSATLIQLSHRGDRE